VAHFDAAMMEVVVTFFDVDFLELLYVETIDSLLKDQSDDIDSKYCYGRGYAVHCLRTME